MARISLIGAGDIRFHYLDMLGMMEYSFYRHVNGIAKALQESGSEIVLLPDRGVSLEVAMKYKEFGGKKAYGTVPTSDSDFGIKHLKQYMEMEVLGNRLFDEIIDTETWYKQDLTHCIYGDAVLMLGNSLGSLGELAYGYYIYKLFSGRKPELKVDMEKISEHARAGKFIPFSTIVYEPFMKQKLNFEIEKYIEKLNGKVYYVSSSEELGQVLKEMPL
ncbi:MAG: hypothetical protein NTY68_03755 [Candidatus Micrarchaeota archaeon]|nr:hypothetical protein [Candidatus Micrarchaeota archaeon]